MASVSGTKALVLQLQRSSAPQNRLRWCGCVQAPFLPPVHTGSPCHSSLCDCQPDVPTLRPSTPLNASQRNAKQLHGSSNSPQFPSTPTTPREPAYAAHHNEPAGTSPFPLPAGGLWSAAPTTVRRSTPRLCSAAFPPTPPGSGTTPPTRPPLWSRSRSAATPRWRPRRQHGRRRWCSWQRARCARWRRQQT
eukprot:160397-Chlamydomonas_euryale.AAC.4